MKQLFFLFYLGVLAVLLMAWYIHGVVLKARSDADRDRVISKAHSGGVRLIAAELEQTPHDLRPKKLEEIQSRFVYPVTVVSLESIPASTRRLLSQHGPKGQDVFYFAIENEGEKVAKALSTGSDIVVIGPFPDYSLKGIEDSIGGWVRLVTEKLYGVKDRNQSLAQIQNDFDFPLEIIHQEDLPEKARGRLDRGDQTVFYSPGNNQWFTVSPLGDKNQLLRFGPFPNFERNEQNAAATTLALVLLPAALAIALLLWPVSGQLRQIENAAKSIAGGDLSARVDVSRVRSAKPLATAFNLMANRTETLVRTQRELLQAVSHELRTPLSRIRFAIDLIETAKDETERKQRLNALDDAAVDLDQLVEELLGYVKLETTEGLLIKEPLDLGDDLETVLAKVSLSHSVIAFSLVEADALRGKIVSLDRSGFSRVMSNLLNNAGRHAKQKVKIQVQFHGNLMTIEIDDDGPGIPLDDRERVFEPFVQLGNRARENNKGVGLGLALVKRILTQQGGSVEISTSPLGGCRVTTVWPI